MANEYVVTLRDLVNKAPFVPYGFFVIEVLCLLTVERIDLVGSLLVSLALVSSVLAIWSGYLFTKKRSSSWRFVLMRLFGLWSLVFMFAFATWVAPHYAKSNYWIYSNYTVIYALIWCASLVGSVLYELANNGLTEPFFLAITKFDSNELDFVFPKSRETIYSAVIASAILFIATIKLGFPDGGIYTVFFGTVFITPFALCTAVFITRRVFFHKQ